MTCPPTGNDAAHWTKIVESHKIPVGVLKIFPLPGWVTEAFRVTGAATGPDKL